MRIYLSVTVLAALLLTLSPGAGPDANRNEPGCDRGWTAHRQPHAEPWSDRAISPSPTDAGQPLCVRSVWASRIFAATATEFLS
jgi:hypothetical protein